MREANSQPTGPGRAHREQEAHVPREDATEEPLWPDGHSSREARDLDFYMTYTKFKRLAQTISTTQAKKTRWQGGSGPGPQAESSAEALQLTEPPRWWAEASGFQGFVYLSSL